MKVYVITEEIYYPEDPLKRILGVVSDEKETERIFRELSDSVKNYNKTNRNGEDVSYDIDEFELGDLSKINSMIECNKDDRKTFWN